MSSRFAATSRRNAPSSLGAAEPGARAVHAELDWGAAHNALSRRRLLIKKGAVGFGYRWAMGYCGVRIARASGFLVWEFGIALRIDGGWGFKSCGSRDGRRPGSRRHWQMRFAEPVWGPDAGVLAAEATSVKPQLKPTRSSDGACRARMGGGSPCRFTTSSKEGHGAGTLRGTLLDADDDELTPDAAADST